MRIAYILMNGLIEILLLIGVVFTPIYVTPGWYFWSVLLFVLSYYNGAKLFECISKWNHMDTIKNAL